MISLYFCQSPAVLCYSKANLRALSTGLQCFTRRKISATAANRKNALKLAYASYESTKNKVSDSAYTPILVMHGLFGCKSNWNSLCKSILQKTNRKVIAIDARNHGDSPHSPDHSYHHMASDIMKLLKDLEIDKIILIGHSMGGGAVMYTALNFPEIVEKLIVVDFSPVRVSPELQNMAKVFEAMRSVSLQESTTLSKARGIADKQMSNIINSVSLRQFLLMNIVESETGKYKWRINLPVLEQAFSTQIATFPIQHEKTYNGPTLFIGGGKSDYIQVNDHPAIKKLFTAAKFQYIPGAGHWLHADKPAEFVQMVADFVNQNNDIKKPQTK